MTKAKIIGTGSYLPKKILKNADLEKMVDTSDEWIVARTGIKQRRLAAKGENTSDMAVKAAEKALQAAGLKSSEIDLILVATLTSDFIFPSTACLVQKKLEAKNAAAIDIQAACSGFIYGLAFAQGLVENKNFKNVLLIASEKLSSIINYEDRSTCVLFGDGASAAVISSQKPVDLKSSAKGGYYEIQKVILGADGALADLLKLPAGGSANPASLKTVENKEHYIKMSGNVTFKHAVRRMETASKQCLKALNMTEDQVDWLIPHQANLRIIEAIAKRFKHLPKEHVYKDGIRKYGNTSACTVGIALDEIERSQEVEKHDSLLFTVFGAGLTWGAALIIKK